LYVASDKGQRTSRISRDVFNSPGVLRTSVLRRTVLRGGETNTEMVLGSSDKVV
jgi:hypothetical protein